VVEVEGVERCGVGIVETGLSDRPSLEVEVDLSAPV
jgi:hypothetical protein